MTKLSISKKGKFGVLVPIAGFAIVIILIGLAVLLIDINNVQSRDTERILEINNLREALQFHYVDKGYYPIEPQWCSLESDCNVLAEEMEPYLIEVPQDPLYPEEGYTYQYRTTEDGLEYKVFTVLEEGGSYGLGSKGSFIIPLPK